MASAYPARARFLTTHAGGDEPQDQVPGSIGPFAPSVLRERCRDYVKLDCDGPYMLLMAPVLEARRLHLDILQRGDGDEHLRAVINQSRGEAPAITHVDYTARIQTVDAEVHPQFHALITAFEKPTGCPMLADTSFNARGEPILCTPEDAYRCFMRTEIDRPVECWQM